MLMKFTLMNYMAMNNGPPDSSWQGPACLLGTPAAHPRHRPPYLRPPTVPFLRSAQKHVAEQVLDEIAAIVRAH